MVLLGVIPRACLSYLGDNFLASFVDVVLLHLFRDTLGYLLLLRRVIEDSGAVLCKLIEKGSVCAFKETLLATYVCHGQAPGG